MQLRKGSFSDFAQRVRESGKKVILYGAGVIGRVSAPYWICEYQLEQEVLCYVDIDSHKQGEKVQIGKQEIPVRPLSVLDEESGRYILLVTVSAFVPVVQALEHIPGMAGAEVYFLSIMLVDIAHTPKKAQVIRTSDTQLIPKTIHYCWFSGSSIPKELQTCIDTWKYFCPDYKIIRWDESNYDIHKSPYMEQAHACKKWGFITDFARLDILYQHGGICLDTDVELIRNLDELLYQPAFCSTEKWGVVNMGISGAQPHNTAIQAMLKYRESVTFLHPGGTENLMSSGLYDTVPLIQKGMRPDCKTQLLPGNIVTVYAPDFFQPFDYMTGETRITPNTFSIHHFSGSWLGERAASERERTRMRYRDFLQTLQ